MSTKKWTLMVVPETHWDREWYLTFQQFRRRLVTLVDNLLHIMETDPEYKYYVFDGQTVVLEDYLEIRPQNRQRLTDLVEAERLFVGPWYVLPDEFLVSGEALIHNLLLGHKIAAEFGRVMKAGYIPDPFGHISQLPQILAGFDLQAALFMRGIGNELDELTNEFWWQAPDGTQILGVHLINSYCNAANLGARGWTGAQTSQIVNMNEALATVCDQRDSLSQRAATPYLLLNNGCDHLEPQPELPKIIKYVNERLEDAEVVHSQYEDYIGAVLAQQPQLGTVTGELHNGKYHPLLSGVFSARMYLKQANEASQTLLERWAEPLSAWAWLEGADYPQDLLWQAWRLLLRNHPHDSICGCSGDQAHREMMPRFAQAQQIGQMLAEESLNHLTSLATLTAPPVPEDCCYARKLVVFNPHNWPRQEPATVKIVAGISEGAGPQGVTIRDAAGNVVPAQICYQQISEYQHPIPPDQLMWEAEVMFPAEVPSLGFAPYAAVAQPNNRSSAETDLRWGPDWIENDCLRIAVNPNGTVTITDKATGHIYEGCHLLENTEDIGDEYDYSSAAVSTTITSTGAAARIALAETGPVRAALQIDLTLDLPESVTPDRQTRCTKTVPCAVSTKVMLTPGSPRIEFETTVDNQARDHRLRVWFPTDLAVENCYAQSHFDVVKRPLTLPEAEGWNQQPQPTKAAQGFVDVNDGQRGLAVCPVGLPEYEVLKVGGKAIIALTLLRAVGWLSRDDLLTRPYNAGPKIPTPEAQCPGQHTFRYGLVPHAGGWEEAELWKHSAAQKAPLRAAESSLNESRTGSPGHSDEYQRLSFLQAEPATLVVTCVKKAERSDSLIVRLYNISDQAQSGHISAYRPITSAKRVNLNEQPIEVLTITDDGQIEIEVPSRRIVTIALRFA